MKSPDSRLFFHFILLFIFFSGQVNGQMITGVWKGRINRQKVEIKIIQEGDSLKGNSYYFESANHYRRYSIRGYFDPNTNSAVWWDDQLLEEKSGRFSIGSPGKIPLLSRADFNCPGSGRMMLNGKAYNRDEEGKIEGATDLDKTGRPQFADEWDFIIENYTVGANDPELIDSVALIAFLAPQRTPLEKPVQEKPLSRAPVPRPVAKTAPIPKIQVEKTKPVAVVEKPVVVKPEPVKPLTIEEKFVSRKKVLTKDIPLSGDSIVLNFYDNGEIDGDSISLFLNDQMLFSHLLLTGQAHSIKLAIAELKEINELTMVAENLGTIPPNTSYMEALVGGQRYSAYLASNEGSSAMIRLVKPAR